MKSHVSRSKIGSAGLERGLGQEINLYRWGEDPRNCQGTLSRDEDGFFIQGSRETYRIKKGNSVGLYIKGNMRYYDVM